jgi:spore coat protein U-like protein
MVKLNDRNKIKVTQIKVTQTKGGSMKKSLVVLAAMMMGIAMVGSALASNTSNVGVSATVGNTCSVLADMTIADIAVDLSQAGPFFASTSGNVRCTNGHDFQIYVSSKNVAMTNQPFLGGTGVSGFQMKTAGGDVLNYSVISSGSVGSTTGIIAGAGFSTDLTVGVKASVPVSGNETAPAGAYTDTVYLTIIY